LGRDFLVGRRTGTVVVDGSSDDPLAQRVPARLRAALEGDRDFAAAAPTVDGGLAAVSALRSAVTVPVQARSRWRA
jgi:hypothetical protein